MIESKTNGVGKTVGAVERAFSIIEALRKSGGMTVTEVADLFEIPSSTAHIYLKTLHSIGYVIKVDGEYQLGLRFLRDGIAVRSNYNIYLSCKDELDKLAIETGEVASLGIEENGQRVLLHQSKGSKAVSDNAPIGEYTHMHWTALGKVILAYLPKSYTNNVLDVYKLPSQTDQTITEQDQLYTELEHIRDQGYALEDEERREGIRSIAVPIIVDNDAIGAISLTGPKSRFNDDRTSDLVELLQNTANVVVVKYSYQ